MVVVVVGGDGGEGEGEGEGRGRRCEEFELLLDEALHVLLDDGVQVGTGDKCVPTGNRRVPRSDKPVAMHT